MNDYVILTDSSCDLGAEMAETLELGVAPLTVNFGGKEYANLLDGSELSFKEFYDGVRAGQEASTSAVSVGGWTDLAEPYLKEGTDVLILAFSSGLSNTYSSAKIAAEELSEKYPERKIFVVDTLCASLGEGLLIYLTVEQKRSGKSIEEARDFAESNKLSVCHWVTVDDLNHLKRGGRISGATAFFGGLLGIKPIIYVDDEGHLINIQKARGRQAALNFLLDVLGQTGADLKDQIIFISHGDCYDDAKYVADQAKERFGVKDAYINYIGPVIGTHAGPGTIALFFMGEKR